jgi:hypothetical protein
MQVRILRFKKLILDHNFFEAHEVLEELWFPIRHKKDDYCLVLKGFINSAVCLELYKRGRLPQSKKVLANYQKYVILEKIQNTKYKKEFLELKLFIDNFYFNYSQGF